MATGRTISANFITAKDSKIISLCEKISNLIMGEIKDKNSQKEFLKDFARISYTRDAGAGVAAGKLQRDALCTMGRQGKAPFSNRNLRWHPLVVAETPISYAKEIDKIKIEGKDESQTLIFVINGKKYPSSKVHELNQRYVALPKHWLPHIDSLKHWSDTLWTQNSCVIPALESCEWYDAVETYAILGITIGIEMYKVDFRKVFDAITSLLKKQSIDKKIELPSKDFPNKKSDFVNCPMCTVPISGNVSNMPRRKRGTIWQPAWRRTKRSEGEESSIQIMHVNPLIEKVVNHNAKNVRYGHRWCNVSMTDHSLEETLDFMEYIVRAHKRCK
ncbi:MAG: hypothetical protein COT24_01405 [Candidatus Kerfeldbacteria bacterium CG08_land_8_20_14_0_20_40_16]|uniref:Uncharacterized protein n=1 Tax=Candidatus Kerfeldbacteria bacterium CG08_land_8_20_14_0_20_40_16 TaxID=2014244 RepID=A0A2H0YWG7_9BACT|nr:MAG: hypothetical protein COT24_01405 [Candidatus Kerfeldbacteria bacterium CG08_land_8_20_14_0_20_40_16]